jgi:sugar O-acyltransferase (sialic acid O-acetyltransferase NeuD family)
MTLLIGVYGAGGCGRGILPIVREQLEGHGVRLVFIDDAISAARINGHEVLNWPAFLSAPARERKVCIAVSASTTREALALKCQAEGVELFEARAASVVQMDSVLIGAGACLSPHVTLTSNIRIGRCFHANLYSYVEHDCEIGDFVTFAPAVKCNGNVVIEDHAYVGTGAIIRQGKPGAPLVIGRGAVVGMGAVVTKSVAPGETVVGNPARPTAKN